MRVKMAVYPGRGALHVGAGANSIRAQAREPGTETFLFHR
jgi:hypothetical protein